MMYYPVDLYQLARQHQQQLRCEAQRDSLARRTAAGADEAERAEEMLSRDGSLLKAKGKVLPARAGKKRAATRSPGRPYIPNNGTKHPH